jgi:hypothetical protein
LAAKTDKEKKIFGKLEGRGERFFFDKMPPRWGFMSKKGGPIFT